MLGERGMHENDVGGALSVWRAESVLEFQKVGSALKLLLLRSQSTFVRLSDATI